MLRGEAAGGDVIQKEQRFRPAGDDVVDAHRDQVDADALMAGEALRQLQLGAHAIGSGHQQGPIQTFRQTAQPGESTDPPQHLWSAGGVHAGANAVDERPSRHHIHARTPVVHGPRSSHPILQW